MTYPPQQPPPGGPYGQQPPGGQGQPPYGGGPHQGGGPYGPPSGPPPGGHQGMHPGQPGHSGHPGQHGHHGGQQGQPGDWGQPQQGYGQHGQQQYGTPPGGIGQPSGFGPPPGQKKSPLPWILAGVGVLVLVGLVVGAFVVLGGGGGGNDPKQVAQTVVDEMNKLENANPNTIEGVLCSKEKETFRQKFNDEFVNPFKQMKEEAGGDMQVNITLGEVKTEGDKGTFEIKMKMSAGGENFDDTTTGDLVKENGDWKVCGTLTG